jgi:hypothetical protein
MNALAIPGQGLIVEMHRKNYVISDVAEGTLPSCPLSADESKPDASSRSTIQNYAISAVQPSFSA